MTDADPPDTDEREATRSVPGWLYARRRRGWLAAFVLVTVVVAVGFWRVETTATRLADTVVEVEETAVRLDQTVVDACERDNRHRQHDLPDAFETFARQLGARFEADPAEIEGFIADMRADLDEQFPAADC